MRSRADYPSGYFAASSLRRALRAAMVIVPGALWVAVPACSTAPNTIRLLEEPDGGPEPPKVSCTSDVECSGSQPFCYSAAHQCVECLSANHCPDEHPCVAETHTCEPPCRSPSDCAGIDRQVCSPTGVCVQCEADADCDSTPLTPHCNLRNGLCVRCLVQADCGQAVCIDDCYACRNNDCVWAT
jgi:hypothetical protein